MWIKVTHFDGVDTIHVNTDNIVLAKLHPSDKGAKAGALQEVGKSQPNIFITLASYYEFITKATETRIPTK